jgi:hypothetical protein
LSEYSSSIDLPFDKDIILKDNSEEFLEYFETLIYTIRDRIQDNSNQSTNIWTPKLIGLTGEGVGTYTDQQGIYYKNKDIIFATGSLTWTAHTGTGAPAIAGFPALFKDNTVGNIYVINWTAPAPTLCIGEIGESYASLYQNNALASALTLDTAATINFTMIYRAP